MATIWPGTMGFSYPDWAGVFYPPGLKPADYLAYYARQFDALELHTTFHATPPADRVRHWAGVTPDGFQFCVKAPREVSHEGTLDRRAPQMDRFVDAMRAFGPKLAAVLVQLPPSCGIDQFEALEHLLKRLPADVRFAVEFRNASWGQQRTLDLLREHRCALVMAEYLTLPRRILATTDFLYVRYVGQRNRFPKLDREQLDVTPSLHWWKDEINRAATSDNGIRNVYAQFNNDYAGYAIATCRRFMRLMGLQVRENPDQAHRPAQGQLFG